MTPQKSDYPDKPLVIPMHLPRHGLLTSQNEEAKKKSLCFTMSLCSPWQQRNNRACCWCHGTPDSIWFIMFSNVFSMADTIEVPSVSTGGAVLRITHHRVETPGCREMHHTRWPVFSYLSCPTWSVLNVCKKTSHGHDSVLNYCKLFSRVVCNYVLSSKV